MAIEKLNKNNNSSDDVLDMTAPPRDDVSNNQRPAKKVTISPKSTENQPSSRIKVTTSGGNRNRVSISDMTGEAEKPPTPHGNPNISRVNKEADDILDLTNPNSVFNQYYNKKVEEYNQRMEQEEEKIRDAVEEGKLDRNSEVAKSWLGDPEDDNKPKNMVRTADIDFDDEEEDTDDDFSEELDTDEDIKEDEEMSEENKLEGLDSMGELAQDVEGDIDEMVEEEDPVMKSLLSDEEEDIEDNEDDYDDVDLSLTDDVDYDDEELDEVIEEDVEEEKVVDTKPVNTVKSSPKKTEYVEIKKPTKLSGVDLAISSKKSELKDDDEEEEESTNNNPQDDELVNKLRRMATEKLKPKTAAIDISNFSIGKASVKNINPVISVKENKIAKWVLINQEQIVLMREFSGVELQTFIETASMNSATNFSRRMRLVYNHIESPKPATFEAWLKCTPYSDLDHYYFGVYVASFNGANYMPIDCAGGTRCSEGTFVSDDVPIMDLVKFTDDKAKSKFKKIYKEETVLDNPEGKFVYNVIPINDSIAIGFKEPMLYDFLETLSIDEQFQRKYASVISMLPYIDNFYVINHNNGTLDPVGYNEFPGNAAKTYRSRIRKYNTLLSYLSPDEYSLIEAYANDIRETDDGITYVTPSLTCPYCGTESEEQEMTAETLVFTRYQLGALVNTTLK